MSADIPINGVYEQIKDKIRLKVTKTGELSLTPDEQTTYAVLVLSTHVKILADKTEHGLESVSLDMKAIAAAQERFAAALENNASTLEGIKVHIEELNVNFRRYFALQKKTKLFKILDAKTLVVLCLAFGVAIGKWGDAIIGYIIVNNK